MSMGAVFYLVMLAVVIFYLIFWVRQFVQLMLLEDELFPGRYDKALWVGVFVFLFLIAPFLFRAWTTARTTEQQSRK